MTDLSDSAERTPTFLARYPRNLKLFVAFLVIAAASSPAFLIHHKSGPVVLDVEPAAPVAAPLEKPRALSEAQLVSVDSAAKPVTPASEAAMRENDTDDRDARMAAAPDPGLVEMTSEGLLPRVGINARAPWQVYARPFNTSDPRPRIAIVMSDLALSNVATMAAMDRLPAQVTMSFDVQSPIIGSWLERARHMGHETLLALPMEPADYPRSDPGPNALLGRLPDSTNLARLFRALRQGSGYIGITSFTGSRLLLDDMKLKVVLDVVKERGLMIFDPQPSNRSLVLEMAKAKHIPAAAGLRRIDDRLTPAAIDEALEQLEKTARLTGRVAAVASPTPLTIERLDRWIRRLPERGLVLAPLSAVLE